MSMRRWIAAALVATALAGCGGDDGGETSSATTVEATTVTAPAVPTRCREALAEEGFRFLRDCREVAHIAAALDAAGEASTMVDAAEYVRNTCEMSSSGLKGDWESSGPLCGEAAKVLGAA